MSSLQRAEGPAERRPQLHGHDAARAVGRLDVRSSHAVLDLGCGDGHHSRVVGAGPFGCIVDLDLDLAGLGSMARGPRTASSQRSFVCADALVLPFAAETFDRVICSLVFYLLPVRQALLELGRVMKPGGRAYVRVPMLSVGRAREAVMAPTTARERLYKLAQVWSGVLYGLVGRQVRNPMLRHDQWACYVPRGRFLRVVRQAGFRIDSLEIDSPRPGVSSIDAWISRP